MLRKKLHLSIRIFALHASRACQHAVPTYDSPCTTRWTLFSALSEARKLLAEEVSARAKVEKEKVELKGQVLEDKGHEMQ